MARGWVWGSLLAMMGGALIAAGAPAWSAAAIGGIAAAGTGAVIIAVGHMREAARLQRVDELARRLIGDEAREDLPGEPLERLVRHIKTLSERAAARGKEAAKKTRNLEALIDGLDEPVIATGNGDRVILCNRAAEEMLSMPAGSLMGTSIRQLFTRKQIVAMLDEARAGRVARGQVPLVTPLGTRTFQVSASPLPAAWGDGVFGAVILLRDMTEMAQSVQVRTEFVANASHELRTPIAAMRAAIETLIDGAKDDPGMLDRLLKMIDSHAGRLEEMARDLLDLSRLESPTARARVEDVDLAQVEQSLRQAFEPACAKRRLTLAFEVDPALKQPRAVRTDRGLVELILRNFVENATKYSHEGTTIRVVAAGFVSGQGGDGDGRWLRLEVIDRGIGIPLSQQERVFERFYQVDQARTGTSGPRGTGLGLAIVKHACKMLEGKVGLESTWGEGTRVWVEVPLE